MSTVSTGTLTVRRLTRDASPEPMLRADVQQNLTIKITFIYGGQTGNTKIVNGQTWYECTGSWSFDPASVEITYGNTAAIKIKMDNNASSNGWKLVQFVPKATNPAGGPSVATAGANGEIDITDSNTVAGNYYYGVYLENPSSNYYASYDPVIVQDGGGD